jgi:hypothetical protein
LPTIAIIDGVRIVIYLKDHLPPHLHAMYGGSEAMISIATGAVLEGELPATKRRAVQSWLAEHRPEVAHVWVEIRDGRWTGRRVD